MTSNNAEKATLCSVTNDEFVKAIFGQHAANCHVTQFDYDPANIPPGKHLIAWKGDYYSRSVLTPGFNQYFTISTFAADEQGTARRRKALFKQTHCIVLDDVREKLDVSVAALLPEPSWILETSPGSEQWGYILSQPETVASRVDNLNDGLIASDLAPSGKDPGQRGVTRYVRLPEGSNTKASKMVDGVPFACRMLKWSPFSEVTLEQLAEPFNINLDASRRESRIDGAADVNDHPLIHIPDVIHIKEERSPGRFDITCPWVNDHTGQDDSGTAVFTNADGSLGFKCHHGHCEGKTGKHLLEYIDGEMPQFRSTLKQWQVLRTMVNIAPPPPPGAADAVLPLVAADLDVVVLESIEEDKILLRHLIEPLIDEVGPMLKSACVEGAKVAAALNIRLIISAVDRLVAIENSKFLALNQADQLVPLAAGDVVSGKSRGFLEEDGKLVNRSVVKQIFAGPEEDLDKLLKQLETKATAVILHYIRSYRYATTIERGINMFDDRSHLELANQVAMFTQTHAHLAGRLKNLSTERDSERVMADVREHFPEFNDFIRVLCAARFAPDRRKAFLWLHAPAGWGKGLLISALSKLSLVTSLSEKDVEAAFEGKPLGLDPNEVTRSWALSFDEVKRVKSELKMLNNEIIMTPKFQKRTKVQVYTKLFTSAESVDSLAGENGVESQFADRFCYMAGTGKIDQRPLFKELGSHVYINALALGMALMIDAYVEEMCDLGELAAYRKAELELDVLHRKYRIDKALGSLDDALKELSVELAQLIRSAGKCQMREGVLPKEVRMMPETLRNKLLSNVSLEYLGGDREPVFALRGSVSFVKEWIGSKVDRSELVKVRYKAGQICELASMRSVKSAHRLHSSPSGGHGRVAKAAVLVPCDEVTAADEVSFF